MLKGAHAHLNTDRIQVDVDSCKGSSNTLDGLKKRGFFKFMTLHHQWKQWVKLNHRVWITHEVNVCVCKKRDLPFPLHDISNGDNTVRKKFIMSITSVGPFIPSNNDFFAHQVRFLSHGKSLPRSLYCYGAFKKMSGFYKITFWRHAIALPTKTVGPINKLIHTRDECP